MDPNSPLGNPPSSEPVPTVPVQPQPPINPQPPVQAQQPVSPMAPMGQVTPEQTVVKVPPPESDQLPRKSFLSKKLLIIIVLALVPLVLVAGVFSAAYAIAYEKYTINNPQMTLAVTKFVQELPFTPKTAKFLLAEAILAHKDIKSNSFDLSLAAQASIFNFIAGTQNLDVDFKGAIDYSDETNPKFIVTGLMGNDLNFEVREKNKTVYLKINKIPPAVLKNMFGLPDQKFIDPVLANWASFKIDTLNTEARQALEQNKAAQTQVFNPLDETVLSAMKVSNDKVDTYQTYKLHLNIDKTILDDWEKKLVAMSGAPLDQASKIGQVHLSDVFTNGVIEISLDKKDYYVRKGTLAFNINTNGLNLNQSSVLGASTLAAANPKSVPVTISVALALKMDNFGQLVSVLDPDKTMDGQQYLQNLLFFSQSPISSSSPSATDAKQIQDVKTLGEALEACKAKSPTKQYVTKLDDLRACGTLTTIPVDPTTTKEYEYRANTLRTGYQLKTTLSTRKAYIYTEKGPPAN